MSKFELAPSGSRLVVKREKVADRTDTGITLPEGAKEKPSKGQVVAIGCGTEDCDPVDEFTEGDTVLFGKYAGTDVQVDGEDFVIVEAKDILARVVKKA